MLDEFHSFPKPYLHHFLQMLYSLYPYLQGIKTSKLTICSLPWHCHDLRYAFWVRYMGFCLIWFRHDLYRQVFIFKGLDGIVDVHGFLGFLEYTRVGHSIGVLTGGVVRAAVLVHFFLPQKIGVSLQDSIRMAQILFVLRRWFVVVVLYTRVNDWNL